MTANAASNGGKTARVSYPVNHRPTVIPIFALGEWVDKHGLAVNEAMADAADD